MRAQETFPLRPDWTALTLREFRRVGPHHADGHRRHRPRAGPARHLGYWIAGVPEPIFFGAATAVASLVPAVGTHARLGARRRRADRGGATPGRGVFELIWGGPSSWSLSDYVIRPRLVGGESRCPRSSLLRRALRRRRGVRAEGAHRRARAHVARHRRATALVRRAAPHPRDVRSAASSPPAQRQHREGQQLRACCLAAAAGHFLSRVFCSPPVPPAPPPVPAGTPADRPATGS